MRRRITAIAAAVSALVLIVAGVAVVLLVRSELIANLDRSLEQRAELIVAGMVDGNASVIPEAGSEDRFVQLLADDGTVVAATRNLDGGAAVVAPPDGRQDISTRTDVPIDDDAYRVLIRRFDSDASSGYVVVGENADDVIDGIRSLVTTLAVVFPLAVAALAALVWWLVGRTLRPVEEIRRDVSEIGLGELDRRVPSPATGDEIDLLAETMNEMLGRLESASSNQRRFVADVSHELRTPLTRMRTALEVDLGRHEADLKHTCRDVLEDAIEMQDLVDDLLFLAHHDSGTAVVEREVVDLDAIIEVEVRHVRTHLGSDVSVDMSDVSAVGVIGDGRQLSRLVRNLLDNAIRHAHQRVEISLAEESQVAVLRVDDDGSGIAAEDRERVFERFVRLDEARSSRDGGAGLGLAIVRDITTSHGGSVAVVVAPIGGVRVELRLPAAESMVASD